jgi:hypothetical protein
MVADNVGIKLKIRVKLIIHKKSMGPMQILRIILMNITFVLRYFYHALIFM